MNVLNVASTIGDYASIYVRKNWPTIATYAGIGCVVGGTVLACKATTKYEETKKQAHEAIEAIKDEQECVGYPTQAEYGKELAKAYAYGGWCFIKAYGPAAVMEILGITLISTSHHEMKIRYASATAAFNALQQSFNHYRQGVIADYGRDADLKYRYGIENKKVEVISQDENGQLTTKKEKGPTVENMDDPSTYSPWARYFDQRSREFEDRPEDWEYNVYKLKLMESSCDQKLKNRGYLFLNEVYEMLDLPVTKMGQEVGWYYDPSDRNLSNYVDFGLCEVRRQAVRDFRNGYEKAILLDFNVDGNIMPYIRDVPVRRLWREPGTDIIHEV